MDRRSERAEKTTETSSGRLFTWCCLPQLPWCLQLGFQERLAPSRMGSEHSREGDTLKSAIQTWCSTHKRCRNQQMDFWGSASWRALDWERNPNNTGQQIPSLYRPAAAGFELDQEEGREEQLKGNHFPSTILAKLQTSDCVKEN